MPGRQSSVVGTSGVCTRQVTRPMLDVERHDVLPLPPRGPNRLGLRVEKGRRLPSPRRVIGSLGLSPDSAVLQSRRITWGSLDRVWCLRGKMAGLVTNEQPDRQHMRGNVDVAAYIYPYGVLVHTAVEHCRYPSNSARGIVASGRNLRHVLLQRAENEGGHSHPVLRLAPDDRRAGYLL